MGKGTGYACSSPGAHGSRRADSSQVSAVRYGLRFRYDRGPFAPANPACFAIRDGPPLLRFRSSSLALQQSETTKGHIVEQQVRQYGRPLIQAENATCARCQRNNSRNSLMFSPNDKTGWQALARLMVENGSS